jgi:DNA-directed RNA polymerase specialized sigma24 family protein
MLAYYLAPFYPAIMDAEAIRQKLADLDEAGRIRALSRALWLITEKHNKLLKRVRRNEELWLQTKKATVKGVELAIAIAKASIPGLFKRKRKKLQLDKRYFAAARLTRIQREVMSYLFEDGWSVARTARHMGRHRTVIQEHKQAAIKKLRKAPPPRGSKALVIKARR